MRNTISLTTARKTITIGLVSVSAGLLVLGSWTTATAQSKKKSILRGITYSKYPVELSFELNGKPLESTESVAGRFRTNDFEADADWLNHLTIKIKNTSGKTITWMLVNLLFPEVAKDDAVAMHQIFLGVDPDAPFPRPELRLAPNETFDLQLNAKRQELRRLVDVVGSGMAIEDITKLEVEFHAALCDDGTRFEIGVWYRRDPKNRTSGSDSTTDRIRELPLTNAVEQCWIAGMD